MSFGRKTQVEKFEARMSKTKKDEEVIKEAEIKNSTLEKRAGKVANQYGMSTEDIFMIIARDSADTFVKMWNNSMENVVRATIQSEIRNVVQQVVQEELASAVRGFMKGLAMNQQSAEEQIKEEILSTFNPKSTMFQNGLQKLKEQQQETPMEAIESKLNEMKQETDNYTKSISIEPAPSIIENDEKAEVYYSDDEKMRKHIIEAYNDNVDVFSVKQFKKISSQHNTTYQKFVKKNKAVNGGWKSYVEWVLSENE